MFGYRPEGELISRLETNVFVKGKPNLNSDQREVVYLELIVLII